ncbi:MAG: hypothetical protein M1834_003666 [Cirrosporium novae-zelandiae]|nr:MAG: hypothetical protein M1834_003666 [Cirrosporium novae-zelandiae]
MDSPNSSATETSPLIPKSTGDFPKNDNFSSTFANDDGSNGTSTIADGGDDVSEGVIIPIDDRNKQFQGDPEARKRLKYIVPAVSLGIFLSCADQTLIVSSYGRIGTEMNSLEMTSWIATAYFLTLSSFQPLYGKLSDIFGRKPALLFAYAVFSLGCLFCGLARDIRELIAARAFAGIGGGGMTTVVSVLMSDIIPLRERGTWQGIFSIVAAAGAGCGAPLGGMLADYIGWRWAFLGQVPLSLIALISVALTLKIPTKDTEHWGAKLRRVDFLGAIILVCATFAFLLGLDRGSNVSWGVKEAYIPLALTLPLFAIFVFVEMNIASEPFAPGHIIFERSLFACYLCNFFSFGAYVTELFYVPLFFQVIDGFSGTQAGVRLLPPVLASVAGSLFGGIFMQKVGKYYWLTIIGYAILTVSGIPLILCSGYLVNSTWGISVGMVMSTFGVGVGVTTTLISLLANASPDDQAIVTACSYLYRCLGSVVGLSLGSTIVQQSLRNNLRAGLSNSGDADNISKKVRQSLDYIKKLNPQEKAVVVQSYGDAIRSSYLFVIGISACALISSFFIREKKLS